MTKIITQYLLAILFISSLGMVGCGDDDDDNTAPRMITYDLMERSDSDIDGSIEFLELSDGRIQAEISLDGTSDGSSHPAHIHMNSAAMGGDILVSLDEVDGATGSSVTIFSQTDDGSAISFDQLDDLDAYVNVHKSAAELNVIIAQGDIGSNVLTGESKTYELEERAVEGIMGIITFSKRKNGNTLAVIDIDNTPDGAMHPAHIHANSAAEGGDIIVSFTPVDGTTGMSMTDIRSTDNGNVFNYEDVISADAYVNVHLSANELSTIVAQGDIGVNELTGESKVYTLNEKDVEGISGSITFEERVNGSVLATIQLTDTPNGGMHPAHIHENSAEEGGPIAVTFNSVDGTTGRSITNISTADGGDPFTYQSIDLYDGYVNVHLSASQLDVIVAQGNIGINN